MLAIFGLILLLPLLSNAAGKCLTTGEACTFPFTRENQTYQGCAPDEHSQSFYCITKLGDNYATGFCNGGCFEDDGSPLTFNDGMDLGVTRIFCKTKASECVFPFTYEGKEYSACTKDGGVDYEWCAIQVDNEGALLDNRWGKCDMSTCNQQSVTAVPLDVEPKNLRVLFREYSGEVLMSQKSPYDELEISASFPNLPTDKDLELVVVEAPCDDGYINTKEGYNLGSLTNSTASDSTLRLSLYPGDQLILNRSMIIKEKDTLHESIEGSVVYGEVLACQPILASQNTGLDPTLLIIIILAVVVVLLIIILVCICCCCCCKRKRQSHSPVKTVDTDSIGSCPSYTEPTKLPFYDEISLPFIDASLPPTPKMGRSRDQLAVLLGRVSRSSLSNEEA